MTMNKADLARVLCRVVGLYFGLSAIVGIGQVVLSFVAPMLGGASTSYTFAPFIQIIAPQLMGLVVGVIVWKNAPAIGAKVAE